MGWPSEQVLVALCDACEGKSMGSRSRGSPAVFSVPVMFPVVWPFICLCLLILVSLYVVFLLVVFLLLVYVVSCFLFPKRCFASPLSPVYGFPRPFVGVVSCPFVGIIPRPFMGV